MRWIFMAIIVAAAPAAALAQQSPVVVVPNPTANRLQIESLRNSQSRELEQLRQNLNREQDRRMDMRPTDRPNVPVVRQPCVSANGLPQSC